MSSGSSGYDPKYSSYDLNVQADGRRYHKPQQGQGKNSAEGSKRKKSEKKSKWQSTPPKATPKKSDTSASTKVGPIPCLNLSGILFMLAVKVYNVVGTTTNNQIPFPSVVGMGMTSSATSLHLLRFTE
ncbi:hypothetical protein DV736_g3405, partial [Chaetothyriales sp. CBS 134916]